jgi:hypothetical protein
VSVDGVRTNKLTLETYIGEVVKAVELKNGIYWAGVID